MNTTRNLTSQIIKLIAFGTVHLSWLVNGQVSSMDKTIGMLNSEFKTFRITRKSTKLDRVDLFKYEFPLHGLESDSKQNLLGVGFYIEPDGNIILIRPIIADRVLPDQRVMNIAINAGEKTSLIFSRSGLEQLGEIQTYGLLYKWAVSILSRNTEIIPNLDLDETQREKINKLFNGKLRVPDLDSANEQSLAKEIEAYAKKILQFDIEK